MAESTLNLTWAELLAEVGSYLGWSRTAANWSANKIEEIKRLMQSGLRKFYFQAALRPDEQAYGWTFLKPVANIQLTATVATAALPDDYGGFEGIATVSLAGAIGGYSQLTQRHDEQLRALYAAAPAVAGRPVYFAEKQVKGVTTLETEKSQLYVYPLPDADYVVSVAYYVLPNYLTNSAPYPYGGAAHAETMKAAVRAQAELYLDNKVGPEDANYRQCLAASIMYDRRHQPKTLGINTDPSDWMMNRNGMRGVWPDGLWHPLGIGYLGTASYE